MPSIPPHGSDSPSAAPSVGQGAVETPRETAMRTARGSILLALMGSRDRSWGHLRALVMPSVETAYDQGRDDAARGLLASIEAAYPAETFPREWEQGEDHRSATVRTVLSIVHDFADRTGVRLPPGQATD